ncbi:hypothetical protein OS493_000430 [Desmophyllum pertusum]|uniref:Uncharacterized protein n=1 Tax=Desmophyllum pertusum TaxID=174260 RepID=A0A9X0A776_9CNID|nr:hypothetical protein OS493_000430 [Desmophyllum pertusum]
MEVENGKEAKSKEKEEEKMEIEEEKGEEEKGKDKSKKKKQKEKSKTSESSSSSDEEEKGKAAKNKEEKKRKTVKKVTINNSKVRKCPVCKVKVTHLRRHVVALHVNKGERLAVSQLESLLQASIHGEE